MDHGLSADITDVHGAPSLVGVHLNEAAHGLNDTLSMGLGQTPRFLHSDTFSIGFY